ncbi:MAG: hypothetical protein E7446_04945 [Ruminococcaceae bacterium]|nr:hypothetical protein [Oscillospiraceae bacterium]
MHRGGFMEETRTKTRVERKKKKVWPWVVAAVAVVAVAVVACVLLWPRPLVTAPGYIAADLERAEIYNEEGGVAGTPARGTQVTYVVEEEDEDYPGLVRLVMGEEEFAWVKKENLVDDPSAVVTTQKMYVRTAVNLLDQAGEAAGYLADKGQELTVTGFEQLDEQGVVGRYQVSMTVDGTTHEGYVRAGYLCRTQEEALKQYDEQTYQLHVERGDSWGGGDAAGLDYFPREKAKFADNVMPTEVKSLYLNNEFVANVDTYLDIANNCGINAFVIDIQDGGAIGYASPTMQKYSPSAYESAYNTREEYQAAVKKIKDAGYYIIGRITAFNDPNLAIDHPECLIANPDGSPKRIVGMYWPSVYNRWVWQYKVDLALEAVELMGFNEIQFDYVRFPDGTWDYEDWEIDYRNTYGESKAQAVQRFLMYAADRIHDAGAYLSADVFGECAEDYVCAYGQYWPAISNVADVISAMPYPDHYAPYGDYLPWEHPYDTLYAFGAKAAQRQTETASPAVVRTWIQAYSAIREPYTYYGPNEVGAQIRALRDTGNTGGYMTWHGAADIGKYYALMPAFD